MGASFSNLSKEDLEFLKIYTSSDEKAIKEQYKEFKKQTGNGTLTPDTFYEMYQKISPNANAKEFCNHVFRTFDADNNGYVSFKEFLLALNISSNGTAEQKLNWAFRLYDINGDGVINRCEMIMIVESMFEMLDSDENRKQRSDAKEKAKSIFSQLDINGDLQLTKDEFVNGCLKDEELTKLLTFEGHWKT